MRIIKHSRSVVAAALITAIAGALAIQAGYGTPGAAAQGSATKRVQADNACYVQLPNLPTSGNIGRYGGFGGYNEETGILVYAGGAEKRGTNDDNTIVYSDMYALDMTKPGNSWKKITYNSSNGWNTSTDRGCREMTSVRIDSDSWISVFGKDGCDGGDGSDGDIKEIQIGSSASTAQVKFRPNSGVQSAPQQLTGEKLELVRNFATYDTQRNRLIVGQGTFDDTKDSDTNDEVYEATAAGSKWNVKELRPGGNVPSRRFSSCAAYVYDKDQGLDGVMVLGGQQGGEVDTTSYDEVWWLDFSSNKNGNWMDISGVFSNLKEDPANPGAPYLSYRRGGACAYNADTKHFYSWMGRANGGIPDGNKRSAGLWRADLSNLAAAVGDASGATKVSFERLAKDKQAEVDGRRLIPSVYDWKNTRVFAIGGRNDLDEYTDAWAIYPDVTGADCQNLDPFSHYSVPVTETPVPAPTQTPDPSQPTPELPTQAPPTPTLDPSARICDLARNRVPGAVVSAATGNPQSVAGYGQRCNPNLAPGPLNPERSWLSLRNPSLPYHPLFNGLVWKCGCP